MTKEARQLTLIAQIEDVLLRKRALAAGYAVRQTEKRDLLALADLYFAAYPRDIVADMPAARDELERTFGGEYGCLDLVSSPLVRHGSAIVAAVMTVEEAPWSDTPAAPFIIEVMAHPDHRRLGLAEYAMQRAVQRLATQAKRTVALRVMSDNTSACALYHKLGFRLWTA
jgi:N-alpha-acetyltransferase 10/11